MKIYYPSYYKEFKCIAERCRHSCCVGWEIVLDEATLEKYRRCYANDIMPRIRDGEIVLRPDGRCPFLDENGLCYIISNYGEDCLSDICHRHPRFYHRVGERVECGIGASCEEACRLILSSDGYADFNTGEWSGEVAEETDFESISHRDRLYSIIGDRSLSYHEKRWKIIEEYRLFDPCENPEKWNDALLQIEYLDAKNRGSLRIGNLDKRHENHQYLERFLAYLILRHVSIAESDFGLRARLGFCFLVTAILENYTAKEERSFDEICDFARTISQEIEYSENNTAELIFELECFID